MVDVPPEPTPASSVVTPVPLAGVGLVLRPWTPDDGPELNRIVGLPEVVRWWGPEDFTEPAGESVRYTILAEGAVRGLVAFHEENEPDFRHAGIDIFLDPDVRGRGLGVEAITVLAQWLFAERGHHRLTIDPAYDNAAAVRAYEKVGFRPVGVLRQYWRDREGAWRDGLLMDLLRDELAAGATSR